MIRQRLFVERYGWTLHVYYAVRSFFVDEIMDALRVIDCPKAFLREAYDNLSAGRVKALTYSNYRRRETVMVIGLASSPREYANSIVHELWHFAVHVSLALGLDMEGEEPAYLIGDTMSEMMAAARELLCECSCHSAGIAKGDAQHGRGLTCQQPTDATGLPVKALGYL